MSSVVVAAIVTGNLALGFVTLGRVVQRSERSLFRYRMWRIRDDLRDCLFDGRIAPSEPVFEYLDRLERMIELTDVLTPYRLRQMGKVLAAGGWKPAPDPLFERFSPEAAKLILAARDESHRARIRLVFFGSPSGWLMVLASRFVAPWMRRKMRGPRAESPYKPVQEPLQTVVSYSGQRYGTATQLVLAVDPRTHRDDRDHPAYA